MHLVAMGQQQQVGDMRIADQRIARFGHRQARPALGNPRQPALLERRMLRIKAGEQRHANQHGVHQRLG
ncbi:hypothetical protein D3C79_863670 [compost metagenome]